MVDFEKLDELKERLTTAERFGDVMDFFFDHFGENPGFMALGKRVKSPFMNAVLERVAKELMGPSVRVTRKRLVLLKKQRFLHGAAHFDGHLTVLFFFRDIDTGMLCCQVGPESRMVRFTGKMIKADEPLALSTSTSRLVH